MPGEPGLYLLPTKKGGAIAMHSLKWSPIRGSRSARLAVLSALVAGGMLLVMVQPAAAQLVDRIHRTSC